MELQIIARILSAQCLLIVQLLATIHTAMTMTASKKVGLSPMKGQKRCLERMIGQEPGVLAPRVLTCVVQTDTRGV